MSLLSLPASSGSTLFGVGAALPDRVVTAADLGEPFGKSGEWVRTRTGIEQLRRADSDSELLDLSDAAARRALDRAGVREDQIDLVLSTSCSVAHGPMDQRGIAAGVAVRAGRMHLNAACSGFCYALGVADSMIRTGAARFVLLVAAERMSGLLDADDLGTSVVFGDGAGAVVVGPSRGGGADVGPAVWGSDGEQHSVIACDPGPGTRLRMAGQQVFRWAVDTVPVLAERACRAAGVDLGEIEVFAPHQANQRIISAVVTRLGLTRAVVAQSGRLSGNTSAASIPIALDGLVVRSGALALLVGFGAGLSYAAQVVRLP